MIDPYTPVLAFLLGLLAGRFLQPWRFRQWLWYLKEFLPHRCPSCRTWHNRHTMKFVRHRTAGLIYLCEACYNEEYRPFTSFADALDSRINNKETSQ